MRLLKLSLIITALIFHSSCKESDDISKEEPYLELWKELLLQQNKLDNQYFSEHVEVQSHSRLSHYYGEYFKIAYQVKYGWFEASLADSLLIKINQNFIDSSMTIPRDGYLWGNYLLEVMKSKQFVSYISYVNEWEDLTYTDLNEAIISMERRTRGTCDSVSFETFVTQQEIPFIVAKGKDVGDPCLLYNCYNTNTKKLCSNNYLNLLDITGLSNYYPCD